MPEQTFQLNINKKSFSTEGRKATKILHYSSAACEASTATSSFIIHSKNPLARSE
jgi:hypothetical protein